MQSHNNLNPTGNPGLGSSSSNINSNYLHNNSDDNNAQGHYDAAALGFYQPTNPVNPSQLPNPNHTIGSNTGGQYSNQFSSPNQFGSQGMFQQNPNQYPVIPVPQSNNFAPISGHHHSQLVTDPQQIRMSQTFTNAPVFPITQLGYQQRPQFNPSYGYHMEQRPQGALQQDQIHFNAPSPASMPPQFGSQSSGYNAAGGPESHMTTMGLRPSYPHLNMGGMHSSHYPQSFSQVPQFAGVEPRKSEKNVDDKFISSDEANLNDSSSTKSKAKNGEKKHKKSSCKEKDKPKASDVKIPRQIQRPQKPAKALNIIKSPAELKKLGKFSQLDSQKSNAYKAIAKFVNKSHDLKKDVARLKIHGIYEMNIKKSSHASTTKAKYGPMLLCFKTTPESVTKIGEKNDGSVAFYDRIARAFATLPENLDRPLRQTILLCSVSLGKIYKHKSGFKTWAARDFPKGYDSVKGVGSRIPDSNKSVVIDDLTILTGKTVENKDFQNYELTYNEYIIYEAMRITVRFAVDIEIVPCIKYSTEESSD